MRELLRLARSRCLHCCQWRCALFVAAVAGRPHATGSARHALFVEVWDEKFTFYYESWEELEAPGAMIVEVWDKDFGQKDDLIGRPERQTTRLRPLRTRLRVPPHRPLASGPAIRGRAPFPPRTATQRHAMSVRGDVSAGRCAT